MQIRELELWQELDDEQAAKISGGDCNPDCIAWSIGFADVVRPSSSSNPKTVPIAESSISGATIVPPTGKIRGTLILP
jgi:hypothetical protein